LRLFAESYIGIKNFITLKDDSDALNIWYFTSVLLKR